MNQGQENKDFLQEEALYKRLIETAPDAMVVIDDTGSIVIVNAQVEKLFEYKREELLGQKIEVLIPERYRDLHVEDRNIFFQTPRTRPMGHPGVNLFGKRKSGKEFPVEVSLSPFHFADHLLISSTIRDISDRMKAIKELKKVREQLERKNEILTWINNDLDNFVYIASHDLKAPLSNIEGLLTALNEILNEGASPNEEVEKIMVMIIKSIDRFKITIQDLTNISKEQKELKEDIEKIEIYKEIELVEESIREEIMKYDVEIIIDTKDCPNINFSKKDFRSIIQNLITNAVKYHSPERKAVVEIRTWTDSKYNLLQVKDNGIGMKDKIKDQIFEMYKRLHYHVEGTGIGLYIVKKIIQNAGGRIEVESEEGVGSTFTVYFKKDII